MLGHDLVTDDIGHGDSASGFQSTEHLLDELVLVGFSNQVQNAVGNNQVDGRALDKRGFGGDAFPISVDGPMTNFEQKYADAGRTLNRASWRRRK